METWQKTFLAKNGAKNLAKKWAGGHRQQSRHPNDCN
jgi:hypothetical protein